MTRGDIYMLDFGIPFGSEPADLRGNVFLPKNESGLSKDSVALIHQIVVVDKFRLEEKNFKTSKKSSFKNRRRNRLRNKRIIT